MSYSCTESHADHSHVIAWFFIHVFPIYFHRNSMSTTFSVQSNPPHYFECLNGWYLCVQHFILFNSHPLFYFFLYLHLICMTEAGNHMARIADMTSTSQNFVVSSLNLFLSWICAIFCMLICAFLSLFANFHHIPMENAHFFTLTHVVTAPVYIYDANLSHTSHFKGLFAHCRKSIFLLCDFK